MRDCIDGFCFKHVIDVNKEREGSVQDDTETLHIGSEGDRTVDDAESKTLDFGEDRFGVDEVNLSHFSIKLEGI